jgi:hypothetical protein
MCTNATKTSASLMQAIEPTLKSLLSFAGLLNTAAATAAINAYDSALAAIEAWTPGTTAHDVLQLVGDFQTIFSALPLPLTVETLGNIIMAGIETVIGVLTANSPAPAAIIAGTEDATAEETQVAWQAHVVSQTTAKVTTLVPTFKRSIWHSAAKQYQTAWNSAVDKGGFPHALKA